MVVGVWARCRNEVGFVGRVGRALLTAVRAALGESGTARPGVSWQKLLRCYHEPNVFCYCPEMGISERCLPLHFIR